MAIRLKIDSIEPFSEYLDKFQKRISLRPLARADAITANPGIEFEAVFKMLDSMATWAPATENQKYEWNPFSQRLVIPTAEELKQQSVLTDLDAAEKLIRR